MKHPNALAWFRFHGAELPLGAWLSFRLHTLRCTECGTRLRTELAERDAALGALDAKRPAVRRTSRFWLAAPALAAAVAVLFVVVRTPSSGQVDEDGLRAKGEGSAFVVYVAGANDAGVALLSETCHAGDALQSEYRSDKRHLLVIGVDPEDHARTLVPLDGTTSIEVASGVHRVPQSWVLDAVRGRERFVAFFSDAPIESAQAQAAAREPHPHLAGGIVIVRECTKVTP